LVIPIDTTVEHQVYGQRLFVPLKLTKDFDYRLFSIVVHSSGKCRAYVLRNTNGDPWVSKYDFGPGTDTLTFHTLDNSTPYMLMLQAREPSGNESMGIAKIFERDPFSNEFTEQRLDTYDYIGAPGSFYYSRTLDVENRDAVWGSYRPSREMYREFGQHHCLVATWHSADEVFMYGHQDFKWFNSGGEAYTFLVDEGIRFDNLLWGKPVWLWADQRENGHNVTKYARACVGMDQVYSDSGLNQMLFAWNEGDLPNEVRRMQTDGMAVTLDADNLDAANTVAHNYHVKKIIFEAWSDYKVGSSRRKWLAKLPEIVSKFKGRS
jgi:hypothetical protein